MASLYQVLPWLQEEMSRTQLKTITVGWFCMILLHYLVKFEDIRENGGFISLNIPDDSRYPSLAPKDTFPNSVTEHEQIPKIIHQTWKTEFIPRKFINWVKTWSKNHPDWTYMLWTDSSAEKLISERYPDFLPVYKSYSENIRRADALRYIVLYEFGGVYADMDMESFKPLDAVVEKHSCFFGQEPYEHPVLDSNFEQLIINAMMGCRKKHPFIKKLIENLPHFSHMWNVVDSTGPHFVTAMYKQYSDPNSKVHNKDKVYIAPAEVFFPTTDPAKNFWFYKVCRDFPNLNDLQQRGCVSMKRRLGKPKIPDASYADHHWIHTYVYTLSNWSPVHIKVLVPHFHIYE